MPGDNGYYAPVAYSQGWTVLAIGIIALVIGWYLFVWLFHRRRTPAAQRLVVVAPEELSTRYIHLVDNVEAAYAGGELSTRAAHQKLSLIVRLYAQEASGVPAGVMTLADLTEAKLTRVADTVARYYPTEFAADADGDVAQSAALARQAVTPWS